VKWTGSKVWITVDRWGPMVVAVLTLFVVVFFGWHNSERVGRLEGLYRGLERDTESRDRREIALQSQIQTWQAYVNSLQKKLTEAGIKVPDPPKPI